MMHPLRLMAAAAGTVALLLPIEVNATTGPGCLVVVNVAANDALNLRDGASADAPIIDALVPAKHGIIHLDGPCKPLSVAWASRWCPVTHYHGDRTTKGWVKARYVRDSECP